MQKIAQLITIDPALQNVWFEGVKADGTPTGKKVTKLKKGQHVFAVMELEDDMMAKLQRKEISIKIFINPLSYAEKDALRPE